LLIPQEIGNQVAIALPFGKHWEKGGDFDTDKGQKRPYMRLMEAKRHVGKRRG
jgi:hypothetical protein